MHFIQFFKFSPDNDSALGDMVIIFVALVMKPIKRRYIHHQKI